MLPSSDSRRLQQRILPSHSNSRSKSQARFHVDAVVKSPSNPLSKSSEQPFDGQPTRGRFKAFFARFRIRNLFFFIIGCASVLLIGWVNISAHDVIPKSSELGQHPAKTTGSELNKKKKSKSIARNLSTKRFSTLGAPAADNSLIDPTIIRQAETNLETSTEESFRSRLKSKSEQLQQMPLQQPPDENLRQNRLRQQPNENKPLPFRDWKNSRTSGLQHQPKLHLQQRRRRQQLSDENQQQSFREEWQGPRDTGLQQPPGDTPQQALYLQQQKQRQDGLTKIRSNKLSVRRNSALDQPQSESGEENERVDPMSERVNPVSSAEDMIDQDWRQQRQRRPFKAQQTLTFERRNDAVQYANPNYQLEEKEVPGEQRREQVSFDARSISPNELVEDEEDHPRPQETGEFHKPFNGRSNRRFPPNNYIEPLDADKLLPGVDGITTDGAVPASLEARGDLTNGQNLACPTVDQSKVNRIMYWKETKDSDYDVVGAYRQTGGPETKYLTFQLNATSIQWNSRRRLLETMVALAFATGRILVLPPKMTLITTMEEMSKVGMSPWLGFQDLMALPSPRFQGISVITMDRFLELEGSKGQLKTTPQQNRKGGTPLSPPNGFAHWDGAANMHELWHYLQTVSYQPKDWDPQICVLGIPSVVKKSTVNAEDMLESSSDVASMDASGLATWMENIWGKHHGRPPPDKLEYQGRPTRVDAPAVERLREMVAERKKVCHYGRDLQGAKVLHLQGDQLESFPFYSFVFFEDWKQDLFVKRLVRDQLRFRDDIVCAAAQVVDHLEAADGVPAQYHGIHLLMRDLVKGDFEEDDLNVAMSMLVEDLKKWIQPGSRLYIATDMDEQRDCFQILRQSYHLVFISYIESLLDGSVKPVFFPMVEQLVLARAHTFVGSYPSAFSAYVNRLRGYFSTAKQKSKRDPSFFQQAVDVQDGSLASYYSAPRVVQKQMRIYQALRQPLGDLEYPVSWRDIDRF